MTAPTLTLYGSTPWSPVNDAHFQAALANPQSYQAYLQELVYLGNAIQQLPEDGWTITTNTDALVVMMQNDEVGTFTVSASPITDPLPEEARRRGVVLDDTGKRDYYLIDWWFTGAASNVTHTTANWLKVAGIASGTLAAAIAIARFGSRLLKNIGQSISAALGNSVADAADADQEEAALIAAGEAGIDISKTVGAVAGGVGMVLGITAAIIKALDQSFELRITVVNRSSHPYLIIPNYYIDHATITTAANSVAYLAGPSQLIGPTALPPSVCSDPNAWPYSPPVQTYNPKVGPQASEYTLAYQNDGLNAPSVMLQLIACTYAPPQDGQSWGTLTPSGSDTCWTGVVVNTHYHTDDAPNIAMFNAGADLAKAEDWYDAYDDVTPASTGTFSAGNTANLGWVLSADSPTADPSSGTEYCWYLVITIDDM